MNKIFWVLRLRILALTAGVFTLTLFLVGVSMKNQPAKTYRSPEEVRREGNRLQNESSLYLQQHAHNPVDWYPWSEEALTKAKSEDKPIFLSIGYSSCHWCHVMEHEVFDHDDVAEFMNQHFVNIKVDREERPDLDAVYMEAVQAITGRGGWPLSVFLTSDQKPFFGGTYFPHDQFLQLVNQINSVYQERRDEVVKQSELLTERVASLPNLVGLPGSGPTASVTPEMIASAALQAETNYDLKWGGFNAEQKFPTPARWQFLLHHYRKTGDRRYANLVQQTLNNMASGGIHDHVGGGFHRYTVDKKWIVPHFEKMLYDNAQLASLYLEAGTLMGRDDFLSIGKDVLDFLIREMGNEAGAFYSSFDADSGGQEGTYYVWTPDEITIATSADDGPVLAELLGVGLPGNFEHGTSVLTRRANVEEVAADYERDPVEVSDLFAKHRANLRTYRAKRVAPGLDKKIVTSWNGMAISAMAHGYAVSGENRYLEAGLKAVSYLWRVHYRGDGQLYRASNEGRSVHDGILDDYAFFASGLLDMYQVTGEADHLEKALFLLEYARGEFRHEKGGFYMSGASSEAPLGRAVDFFDSVIPSGNAAMLQALLSAAALTGNRDYRQDVSHAMTVYANLIEKALMEMSWWLDAAVKLNGPFYEVIVAGDSGDQTETLVTQLLRTLPVNAVVVRVPASGPSSDLAKLVPPAAGKKAVDGKTMAYVCEFGACQQPTADAETLLEQLAEGWKGAHTY